jgi:hypothetical protein
MGKTSVAERVGLVLTIVVVVFLLMDGGAKVLGADPAVEGTMELGFAESHVAVIGILALLGAAIYAWPRTAVLGAVILTGYLGGAVSVHLLEGNPIFTHTLFPVYLGALAWGALLLRDGSLRQVFPLRHRTPTMGDEPRERGDA